MKMPELRSFKIKKHSPNHLIFQNNVVIDNKHGLYGIADFDSNIILEPVYSHISNDFHEGRVSVQQNDKYGFLDEALNLVIPCIYEDSWFSGFSDGINAVKRHGRWGGIDVYGNKVIDFKYAEAFEFVEGLACVTKSSDNIRTWEVIDKDANVITSYDCTYMDYNGSNILSVTTIGKRAYIDFDGNEIIPYEDTIIGLNHEDRIHFCQRDKQGYLSKFGFYDINGNVVVKPVYSDVNIFSEGRASVCKAHRYAYIDVDGNVKTPFEYKDVGEFHEGLAYVQVFNEKQEKWFYTFIDTNGNQIIEPEFTSMNDFVNGHALVRKKRSQYFILTSPIIKTAT